jgi:hypothetical protein
MGSRLQIVIADRPDREELVAEMWCDERHIADISMESNDAMIELYSGSNGGGWELSLSAFEAAIQEAKHKLGIS